MNAPSERGIELAQRLGLTELEGLTMYSTLVHFNGEDIECDIVALAVPGEDGRGFHVWPVFILSDDQVFEHLDPPSSTSEIQEGDEDMTFKPVGTESPFQNEIKRGKIHRGVYL